MNASPEKRRSVEHRDTSAEHLELANEQREVLRHQPENLENRHNSHEETDEARREALEKAQSIENIHKRTERKTPPIERHPEKIIGKKERDASFNATMHEVQSSMPTSSRVFSKVIHNKTVERVSEVTGSTIARPNAILSGAIMAFALTLALYLIAKDLGYVLSGFETIGAFILGWVLGLTYDFLKVMVTGRK